MPTIKYHGQRRRIGSIRILNRSWKVSQKENNALIEEAKRLLTLPEGAERTRLIENINKEGAVRGGPYRL